MRARLLGLLLGCGLAAAAATSALACSYNMTTASGDQSTQTAQSQPIQPDQTTTQ